jgi:hypothetical protein
MTSAGMTVSHYYIPPAPGAYITTTAALENTWGVPSMLPPTPLVPLTVEVSGREKGVEASKAPVAVADAGPDTATLDDLEDALDEMHCENVLFAGRFRVLGGMERRYGGQGIVQV